MMWAITKAGRWRVPCRRLPRLVKAYPETVWIDEQSNSRQDCEDLRRNNLQRIGLACCGDLGEYVAAVRCSYHP